MLEKIKNLKWHFQLLILVSIATMLYIGCLVLRDQRDPG